MGEATPGQAPVRRRRWPRRLLKGFLLFLLVIVLLLVGFDIVWRYVGAKHLAAAVDEATRQDPNWRWDDLQASRVKVADGDNAALQINRIAEHLPASWPQEGSPLRRLAPRSPSVAIEPNDVRELRDQLNELAPALTEAHALTRFPSGRFPAAGAVESFASTQDHLKRVQSVANLLRYEALLLAEDGKVSEAVVSARTILHAGRALGDEPGSMAMLVRLACRGQGIRGAERALAQGEASDAVLAATRKLMDEEDSTDLLTPALRGERAQVFEVYEYLEAGDLERLTGGKDNVGIEYSKTTFGQAELWLKVPWFRENRAQSLEWATREVENALLPETERLAAFERLDQEAKRRHTNAFDHYRWYLASLFLGAHRAMAKASLRTHAELRCASAGLAAERYRLVRGKWPDSLDALVPAYLPAVPADPFTGEPMHLRRLEDGLVIYSVGADKKDHGGNLEHLSEETYGHADYGFRLWDVKYRRQAPPPGEQNSGEDR